MGKKNTNGEYPLVDLDIPHRQERIPLASMNEVWYSKEWDNAPMPHAIFFTKDGHAIHGSYEVKHLGRAASHGCVRISPKNAATLYGLVGTQGLTHTQVVLTGVTPGGESKVASRAPRPKPKMTRRTGFDRYGAKYYEPGGSWYGRDERSIRRRGFGPIFVGPNRPQGYYGPLPGRRY